MKTHKNLGVVQNLWEPRFQELAAYNGEVHRGIAHTTEKKQRMEKLQREFDAKYEAPAKEAQAQ